MAQGTQNDGVVFYLSFHNSLICICFLRYQIFHKRMPSEAVDLVSILLQYSPNLRFTVVSE